LLLATRQLALPYQLALILAIALLLNLCVALALPDQGLSDPQGYRDAGYQLLHALRIDATYIMPLYPLLVGLAGGGFGQVLLDALLSTLAVWLVFRLTLELFADRGAAYIAALVTAFYPYLIFYSAIGLTEPLFVALLLAAFLAWYRGAFVWAAVFAVLGILTRPAIELLGPVLVGYFAYFFHGLGIRAAARQLIVYAAVYMALMSPWWAHNYAAYGSFVRLNLGAGMLLYAGNNPMNQSGGGIDGVDWDLHHFDDISDPVMHDRAYRDAALNYIREQPAHFIDMAARKFIRFWQLWPYAQGYRSKFYVAVSLLSFGPVLVLSLVYLALWGRRDLRKITPILILTAYLTAVHCVLVSSIRYRLPIEPFLIIFASVAISRIARGLSKPGNFQVVGPESAEQSSVNG
jgi:4-amino-4-deoxy-L-arabinose transferase-like glycosyltransferase